MAAALIPRPRAAHFLDGAVRWTSPLRIKVGVEFAACVDVFANDLQVAVGFDVTIVDDDADLVVRRDETVAPEGYRLSVDDVTYVDVSESAGLAYALTTLRQLGPVALWSAEHTPLTAFDLPKVRIDDFPNFSWRGVHLDVSRHFFDVAAVCRLVDQLAAHRLNRLHLHLNDDQGWRVEVPNWPRLTEVGAWRRSSPVGHEDDGVDDDVGHGGFYSAGDIGTICRHAASRMVEVVPEIDLPGHAQAVIAAYPELGNVDEPLEVWTRWGISEHVLNVSDAALDFAVDVVTYVASLFPGGYFHIGGDECPTSEWEHGDHARSVLASRGLEDVRELQGLFTSRLEGALKDLEKSVIAWDEVLDADVSDETIIAAWRSPAKGTEAARRGHAVIMAPMQFLYFDWLNSLEADEPVALAPPPYATPWEKVYGFEVIPRGLEPDHGSRILGAQAQLWTEYIATRSHLDYMAFPRLAAFSEVVWGTTTSVEEFAPRLVDHAQRLAAMGVNYRPLDPR